jgi:hypothetical protein
MISPFFPIGLHSEMNSGRNDIDVMFNPDRNTVLIASQGLLSRLRMLEYLQDKLVSHGPKLDIMDYLPCISYLRESPLA